MNEVAGPRDLDVEPLAVAQRLRPVRIIIAVVRQDHRRIGKVLVQDRVDVGGLRLTLLHPPERSSHCGVIRIEVGSHDEAIWAPWPIGKRHRSESYAKGLKNLF